ncbi:aldehyde oxidase GLOX1-like isoform X2 [Aristolochia californica]|uniref:aldehyde oxidase GLOX1-like isoform X2 n=1 Tax=Aristolochia californica TaxID=171875 RepID=UPI0035E39CDD
MRSAIVLVLGSFLWLFIITTPGECSKGKWKLLKRSVGISAMHLALLPNSKIIAFDRTDFGPSKVPLPHGKCRLDDLDQALRKDCYAHSVEFDLRNRNVRPLTVLTDTWCSSGALSSDGTLVQSGGFNDGERTVRYFSPCDDCDWVEDGNALTVRRWYASNQILPNGKIIVLPFLKETKEDALLENNLYPFLHLSPDGNLFIFANNRAILLDYTFNRIVKRFPVMPGGVARNYPSTGSSVLLPLVLKDDPDVEAEVFICGGAPPKSNYLANKGTFLPAAKSCGRLKFTDAWPSWKMEEMPLARVMGDMILLPTGDVLIINGAAKGTAGWDVGREPVLNPVLYRSGFTYYLEENKFEVMNPSPIPRMYHSTANLLPDGRVLVGGSNPHQRYNFSGVLFPTELSLEAFYPPYLTGTDAAISRPEITVPGGSKLNYNQRFSVVFTTKEKVRDQDVYLTMVAPSFTTHSFSMNQRVLVLKTSGMNRVSGNSYVMEGVAPTTAVLAPRGYYLLHVVVNGGIPSRGTWVHIK